MLAGSIICTMKNSILAVLAASAVTVCLSHADFATGQPTPGTGEDYLSVGDPTYSDPVWRKLAAHFGGVEADTEPSRDVTMRFSFPTEIREVLVVGGQRVKRGELMIRARDTHIRAAVELGKLRASNELEIRAGENAVELAEFKFQNAERAKAKDAYSATEFEERRIELQQARIQLEQTKVRLREQQLTLEQAEGQYEQFRLEAPFDGIVEEVMVDVGQGVNEQVPAIRVVNTEQLRLDAYPRTFEVLQLGLKEGSKAWVLLNHPDGPRLAVGKVLYVSPVADSVSQRIRVRVEINNTAGFPAGMAAMVRFTEPPPPPSGQWQLIDDAPVALGSDEAAAEEHR